MVSRMTLLVALALVAITPLCAESADLNLRDAIRQAVERNLDLRAELYNPAQYEADVNRNRAIYDPLLTLQGNFSETNTGSAFVANQTDLNSSLSRQFWTGGTASVFFNNSYLASNSASTWESQVGIGFSQPLLKNAGREATEMAINVSRLNKFASLEHVSFRLLSLIAQVRTEYYRLYELQQQVEVKKVSLELAKKILAETKARVSAGVLPAMEILNAEFGVVTREKDINDAYKAVSDQNDVLRLLLQMSGAAEEFRLSDAPRRDPYVPAEADALQRALNRPDIREQKRTLESNELQMRVYNAKIKPDLTLSASAYFAGTDHNLSRDLDKTVTADSPAWKVGVNFVYPFGNSAADNEYRRSRLKVEQLAVQIRSLEENAANEVRTAIRGIASAYKQIEVTDRGRAFAEERLRAFIRKNEVGLATTKDVLDVENDLVAAKSSQNSALVSYANALTRYWQVTGELLEKENVHIVEGDVDKLYRFVR